MMSIYDNFLIIGDINSEAAKCVISMRCTMIPMRNPALVKNPENPTCSDSILTNSTRSFTNIKLSKLFHQIYINQPEEFNYMKLPKYQIKIKSKQEEARTGKKTKEARTRDHKCNKIIYWEQSNRSVKRVS